MAYISFQPSDFFNTVLHTGNNNNGRTFTGLNFQPDFIWGKVRNSGNYNHMFVDSSRGGDKFLAPNTTAAEDNKSHGEITSWNSDGTTWIDGTNASYPRVYYNDGSGSALGGSTYAWWQWKANGGTTSSNTDGSITSTVQANTTSGFSIVTYTGTGANATVGHGLGVAPKMIIVKGRNTTSNWGGYHESIGNTSTIKLNSTDASASNIVFWNNTSPTSSVFTVGTSTDLNASGSTYVAYCFAEIKGYSKFGSYTGNANADGPFIYTGFRPAFVMIKGSSIAENWVMQDTARDPYNLVYHRLDAERTNAETTNIGSLHPNMDYVSNGFKIRGSANVSNGSGQTYIYMAFAEFPVVGSNGVAGTAR